MRSEWETGWKETRLSSQHRMASVIAGSEAAQYNSVVGRPSRVQSPYRTSTTGPWYVAYFWSVWLDVNHDARRFFVRSRWLNGDQNALVLCSQVYWTWTMMYGLFVVWLIGNGPLLWFGWLTWTMMDCLLWSGWLEMDHDGLPFVVWLIDMDHDVLPFVVWLIGHGTRWIAFLLSDGLDMGHCVFVVKMSLKEPWYIVCLWST